MARTSRRQIQAEQHTAYLEQRRRAAAGYVRDGFPNVVRVTATFDYDVYGLGLAAASTKEFVKEPQHRALFTYPCRLADCRDGGYDLDDEVVALLTAGEDQLEGTGSCRGDNGSRFACGDHARYVVRAEYLGPQSRESDGKRA